MTHMQVAYFSWCSSFSFSPQFSGTKVHKWRPEVIFSSLWGRSCGCFVGRQFPWWVLAAKQQACVLFLTPWHSATFHCSQLKTTLVGNTHGKPRKATMSKAIGSGTGKSEIGLYWSAPPFILEVSTWEIVFDIHNFSFKSSCEERRPGKSWRERGVGGRKRECSDIICLWLVLVSFPNSILVLPTIWLLNNFFALMNKSNSLKKKTSSSFSAVIAAKRVN